MRRPYAAAVGRYASVYPLVTARALAREFTYEVDDDIRPGALVEVRFGNARRRGVVIRVGVQPPEGMEAARVGRVVDLELAGDDEERARAEVARMCERLLANPLIESYEITFDGGAR